jgi:hypothetical protein
MSPRGPASTGRPELLKHIVLTAPPGTWKGQPGLEARRARKKAALFGSRLLSPLLLRTFLLPPLDELSTHCYEHKIGEIPALLAV